VTPVTSAEPSRVNDEGPTRPAGTEPSPVGAGMFVALGLLSTFGPISLDLYLPALPALAKDLSTSTSAAQLSITACLIGLSVGQLIAGPMSDRLGRRGPLIVGLVGFVIATAACAFAPTIGVLLALRLVQGICGGAGLVIARAVARDLYSGSKLVVFLARLMIINGLAPILAPVIGGQLVRVTSWRGIFVVLATFGVVLLGCGLFGIRESLPREIRTAGGLPAALRNFRILLSDRLFVGTAVSAGLASAAMFAYIGGATFVLQDSFGLSAQGFSFAFATNAVGIVIAGQVAGRLAHTVPPERLLAYALAQNLTGAALLLIALLVRLPLPVVLIALFVMVSSIGISGPSSTALAMAEHPQRAGAAASLLGLGQYVFGAIAAPLVGIAGSTAVAPLGLVCCGVSLLATAVFWLVVRPNLPTLR